MWPKPAVGWPNSRQLSSLSKHIGTSETTLVFLNQGISEYPGNENFGKWSDYFGSFKFKGNIQVRTSHFFKNAASKPTNFFELRGSVTSQKPNTKQFAKCASFEQLHLWLLCPCVSWKRFSRRKTGHVQRRCSLREVCRLTGETFANDDHAKD